MTLAACAAAGMLTWLVVAVLELLVVPVQLPTLKPAPGAAVRVTEAPDTY